jgi:hypothetical protein
MVRQPLLAYIFLMLAVSSHHVVRLSALITNSHHFLCSLKLTLFQPQASGKTKHHSSKGSSGSKNKEEKTEWVSEWKWYCVSTCLAVTPFHADSRAVLVWRIWTNGL